MAELRKQLFSPGLLVRPLVVMETVRESWCSRRGPMPKQEGHTHSSVTQTQVSTSEALNVGAFWTAARNPTTPYHICIYYTTLPPNTLGLPHNPIHCSALPLLVHDFSHVVSYQPVTTYNLTLYSCLSAWESSVWAYNFPIHTVKNISSFIVRI